jgi:hypothetical protein
MEPVVENGPDSLVPGQPPTPEHEHRQLGRHKRLPSSRHTPSKEDHKSLHLVHQRTHDNTHTHTQTYPTLKQAPDGAYLLIHSKKDTSTQNTNFVITLAEPTAYAMLATLTDPIKTPLPTNTTTRGQTRQQNTTLNSPHTQEASSAGRTRSSSPTLTSPSSTPTSHHYGITRQKASLAGLATKWHGRRPY